MNFLAHAALAQKGSDDFLLGNLIADGIKGRDLTHLKRDVAYGVAHHRSVDAAIDSHLSVLDLLSQIPNGQRRFAGIAFDVVWDHFIASNLKDRTLINRSYRVLSSNPIPGRLERMVKVMIEGDWLSNYADFDFTLRAIAGIGQRLSGPNQLLALTPWLETHYSELSAAYSTLWPEMQARFGLLPYKSSGSNFS